MNILIVEDENGIVSALQQTLSAAHYMSHACYDGISGLDEASTGLYDVILLDVMLPGKDGFDVLSELRGQGINTPVIMLTARTALEDRVKGLDYGADYYLTKPFESGELLAIIRAVSRRKDDGIRMTNPSFGDISIDEKHGVLLRGSDSVRLSARELNLLQVLIEADGGIVSKDRIAEKLWGLESEAEYNSVEVYISFIRKKLDFIRSNVVIRTARGLGYMLEEK